jgi:citrate lyase synthetase
MAKYGNRKSIVDGVKFDSSLEKYCHFLLNALKIEFEFQKTILLQEGFRYSGKAIRPITMIVDFVLNHDGKKIYVDTKGMATEVSKIKYKMLKFYLKDDVNTEVVWLHSKKEVSSYLNNLKNKNNVNTKQSTIDW